MSIKVCRYCRAAAVVAGPRNVKTFGVCGADGCRTAGLIELAQADMLTADEWTELERRLI